MVMCVNVSGDGAAVRTENASSDGILHHKFLEKYLPRKNCN